MPVVVEKGKPSNPNELQNEEINLRTRLVVSTSGSLIVRTNDGVVDHVGLTDDRLGSLKNREELSRVDAGHEYRRG